MDASLAAAEPGRCGVPGRFEPPEIERVVTATVSTFQRPRLAVESRSLSATRPLPGLRRSESRVAP